MFFYILILLFSVIFSIFLFWRRLREDYLTSQIFTAFFYSVFGFSAMIVISLFVYKNWWFWLALIRGHMGLYYGIYRFKLKIFEVYEAFVFAGITFFSITGLTVSFIRLSLSGSIYFFITLLLIPVYFLLSRNYKKISLYRSGRFGVAGVSIAALFFLIRIPVAVSTDNMISFVGKIDWIPSAVSFFIFLIVIIYLAFSK